MRKIIVIFRACMLIIYALLLLVHFVLKDHFQFLQIIFYAFPLPNILFVGACISFILLFIKPRSFFIYTFLLTVVITGIWLNTAYIFPKAITIPENATSVIFWNTANRRNIHVEILSENIKTINPDIISLVEAENASEEDLITLTIEFPDYEFQILEGDMLIGVKGKIKNVIYTNQPYNYDINFVEAQLQNTTVWIAITDTFQSPTMDKRHTLGTVLQLVSEKNADLIVGDFNTPYESVHFNDYKTNYTSFHDYGQGFSATWPFGIPLLELDQIYVSKRFAPLLLQKKYYDVSDHAMLIGYFK